MLLDGQPLVDPNHGLPGFTSRISSADLMLLVEKDLSRIATRHRAIFSASVYFRAVAAKIPVWVCSR